MITIERKIEIHATDACNLRCRSCSHFSSSGLNTLITPEEADRQMAPWAGRVQPNLISILGGEPTINPRLSEILLIARRHWPGTPIRLTTNGFFLDRHLDLPQALLETKTRLDVTKHDDTPEYEERWKRIEPILDQLLSRKIDVRISVSDKRWTLRYHGSGASVRPFGDNDQLMSWKNCVCRHCHQLYDGSLWKCPILAYLTCLKRRWPEISEEWELGLSYRPLKPDASDDEIRAWFALEDEAQCSLCPAHPPKFDRPPVLPSSDATRCSHDP